MNDNLQHTTLIFSCALNMVNGTMFTEEEVFLSTVSEAKNSLSQSSSNDQSDALKFSLLHFILKGTCRCVKTLNKQLRP